jgi:hypothetical protein
MPHKVTNDSNSTLASGDSSTSDQVIATEVRGMSIQQSTQSLDSARLMQTRTPVSRQSRPQTSRYRP